MSGTRFARTGRCRFFVCLGAMVLMFTIVAIVHNSQQQLDETRTQRLRCEQQQEALNEQLQSVVEEKFSLKKTYELERNDALEARRNLDQKFKDLSEIHNKEQTEERVRYEKLQQSHKLLQAKHNDLVGDCGKSKQQFLEEKNASEKKMQALRSEFQKSKSVQDGEIALWKEKYNTDTKELKQRMIQLERTIADYRAHCYYKPKNVEQQQINKPLSSPDTTHNASPQVYHGIDKPKYEKSFNEQQRILPRPIKKLSEETETQLKQQPDDSNANGGNKVASPLSAPRKPTSTEATKSKQYVLEANAHLKPVVANNASTSSSTSLPPLVQPPNQRKLPENVAPIPANFDELLKNDATHQKEPAKLVAGEAADIDAAVEEMQKNENEDGGNNRYANVVNDLEHKVVRSKDAANEDSGAHEIKDRDFVNEQNFNIPAEDDNSFFDGGKNEGGDNADKHKDEDNEDEDMMGAGGVGDIAVKSHNQLLDADNLNNEVAGDQGKEFPDGLRLEDGNDEDEDEDDYSNMAARKKGAQAIRD